MEAVTSSPILLGFDNPEEMQLRADLVQQLHEIIRRRRLTQIAAAKLLGTKQLDLSALLHGRLTKYSLGRLLKFMAILDRDVEIVVKAKPRHQVGAADARGGVSGTRRRRAQ